MKVTKKYKIMKLFNEAEWINGNTKMICGESFRLAGLNSTVEYQEKYCDVLYAAQIFRKMGYRVMIGMCLNIYKQEYFNVKK